MSRLLAILTLILAVPPGAVLAAPAINVWYGDVQSFGGRGKPQPWVNIVGNIPNKGSIASLTYQLNPPSTPVNLSMGPDTRRLEKSGDFNIDLHVDNLLTGANTVLITATDTLNVTTMKAVTVNYTPGNTWELPYSINWDSLASDGNPATPDSAIQQVSQVIDGSWSLVPGGVRTVQTGYDRLLGMGDVTWEDYEFLVPITWHTNQAGYGIVGILLRWNGHTDIPVSGWQPKSGWIPLGAILLYRMSGRIQIYGNNSNIRDEKIVTLPMGPRYWFRGQVQQNPGLGGYYRLRIWEDGTPEPTEWDVEGQEDFNDPSHGSPALITHLIDVTFGDIVITPLGNQPPVAVADTAVVASGDSVVVDVLANDTDPEAALVPGSVTITQAPWHGTASVNPSSGAITYVHDGSATTSDSLTYTVKDIALLESNPAKVRLSVVAQPLASDDFNACLMDSARWDFIDPTGTAAANLNGGGSGNASVTLSLPPGAAHDAWAAGGNQSARLMQTVPPLSTGLDFDITVKFNQEPGGGDLEQGILVEWDDDSFLRFNTYHDGSEFASFVGETTDGSHTILHDVPIAPGSATHQRVRRSGINISFLVSSNGSSWSTVYSISRPGYVVTKMGAFAANPGIAASFDCSVDFIFNSEVPVPNEDGATYSVDVTTFGNGIVLKSPDQLTYACGDTVLLTAVPDSAWLFSGWSGEASGTSNPLTLVVNGSVSATATFDLAPVASTIAVLAEGQPCITGANPCAMAIPVEYSRGVDPTSVGFFSATFALTNLTLCDSVDSVVEGPFLSSIGPTAFMVTDHQDGSYTVDGAILGEPCGVSDNTGTLFYLDVTHAVPSGLGTISLTSVILRDCDNQPLLVEAGAPATLLIETGPPVPIGDLTADRTAGSDSLGVAGIALAWSPVAGDTVRLYRKGFGGYPEYDDAGGSIPAPPADPAAALSAGWSLAGTTTGTTWVDSPLVRDAYHYVAFRESPCGQISAVSNMTPGTLNYLLGDVAPTSPPPRYGDNTVELFDISLLGAHYGTSEGQPLYLNSLDVGPTEGGSVLGRPTTDNFIQFEDLILFAVNFGETESGPGKPSPMPLSQVASAGYSNRLEIRVPIEAESGTTFEVPVTLFSGGSIQGLTLSLAWDHDRVEPVSVRTGELLERQDGTPIALSPAPGSLDIAVFGGTLTGEGVLAIATFRRIDSGDPGIRLAGAGARGSANEPLKLEFGTDPGQAASPTPGLRTRLLPGAPNPFRGTAAISYEIAIGGQVSIDVFSVDGRRVRRLLDSAMPPGRYQALWDGTLDGGQAAAAGIYLIRLRTPEGQWAQRIARVK